MQRIKYVKWEIDVKYLSDVSADSSRKTAFSALSLTLGKVPAHLDAVSQALITTYLDHLDIANNLSSASFIAHDIVSHRCIHCRVWEKS